LIQESIKGTSNIKTELIQRKNNNEYHTLFPIPTLEKIKNYLRKENKKDFIVIDKTIDIINWYHPFLCTNADDFDRKDNDYELIVVAEPLRTTKQVLVYDLLDQAKVDIKGKKITEEKTIISIPFCSVKMLCNLKEMVKICDMKVHLQVDGIYNLSMYGWVWVSFVLFFMR